MAGIGDMVLGLRLSVVYERVVRNVLERVLNLLIFLLTSRRPVPADEIRRTVAGYDPDNDEAFKRMFERDKDLLRRMGIPLRVIPTGGLEIEYGYVIPPEEYRLPDPGLTDEERAALMLAAQVIRFGSDNPGTEALLKLGGAPPGGGMEPFTADLGAGVDVLADLYQAVVERRLAHFGYRDRRRVVQPHGVGHRHGHWYLAAVEDGETRVFRVDRIQDLVMGDEVDAFARREGISVRQALSVHPWESGAEPPVEVVVRFDPTAAWWAERRLETSVARRTLPDGGLEVSLGVVNLEAFIGWLLGFGDEAVVVSPPEVRAALIERVRGVT